MPRGVTLVEMLVFLVLLGLLAGVVGLTLRTARPVTTVSPVAAQIAAARDSAIRSGRAVTIALTVGGWHRDATAYPDGQVAADSGLGVDPLTGGARDTEQ